MRRVRGCGTTENDNLKKLHAARMRTAKARREVADTLTENFRRGHTEVIKLQDIVEVVDRTILGEKSIAAHGRARKIPLG